nr:MAG TPA: hypothetical protein [Caudoviricetes sp.]
MRHIPYPGLSILGRALCRLGYLRGSGMILEEMTSLQM